MNAATQTPALIIFDTVSLQKPRGLERSYATLRGAKTALTAYKKRVAASCDRTNAKVDLSGYGNKVDAEELMKNIIIGTYADFGRLDYEVETTNILGTPGNKFMIKRSLKNTCCDPSTERYHTL